MATFDVLIRTDRWSQLFTGAGVVDAGGRAIGLRVATAKPSDEDTSARIILGGNGDGDDNRYAYDGVETVYARLEAGEEPHRVTVLQDGTTSAPRAPFLPHIALATDADTTLTGAAGALFAQLEAQNACTVTAIAGGTVGEALNLVGGGALTVNANGSYAFNPDGDFNAIKGDASALTGPVTITVTDGTNSLTDTATISVRVSGVNDGPTAGAKVAAVDQGETVAGNLLTDTGGGNTAASHPQAEPLVVAKIAGKPFAGGLFIPLAGGGQIRVNGLTGAYTYDPQARAPGAHVIAFTVADRFGAEASANLTVTVSAPA